MSFRFNRKIYHAVLKGLVVFMLFGLLGCGRNKSAEDIALKYLKKTYNKDFVVEELTRKDAGPFKTAEYSGFAYEKEHPENCFKVWVDKNRAKVTDAYYGVAILPKATEWLQKEASAVRKDAKVGLVVDVIRPRSDVSYPATEYRRFFEDEAVDCQVYLLIQSEEELTFEQYKAFDDAINPVIQGYVQIFYVSDTEMKSLNISAYYKKSSDFSIRIGAPITVIKEKFQGGGD